jgi:hypothetical protein
VFCLVEQSALCMVTLRFLFIDRLIGSGSAQMTWPLSSFIVRTIFLESFLVLTLSLSLSLSLSLARSRSLSASPFSSSSTFVFLLPCLRVNHGVMQTFVTWNLIFQFLFMCICLCRWCVFLSCDVHCHYYHHHHAHRHGDDVLGVSQCDHDDQFDGLDLHCSHPK